MSQSQKCPLYFSISIGYCFYHSLLLYRVGVMRVMIGLSVSDDKPQALNNTTIIKV